MTTKNAAGMTVTGLSLSLLALLAVPVSAQNRVEGKLEVNGKAIPLKQVYAYAVEGFFDKNKQDVVVLSCSDALPAAAVRDNFARKALVDTGKLSCVQQVINTEKQVINFEVRDKGFGSHPQGGGSSEHVFDAKTFDGKNITGRAWTKSPQKSFDDVPYGYDFNFSAAIEPKK